MKFTIEIQCDNAAFEDDPGPEVAKILKHAAGMIATGRRGEFWLRDTNGNKVGQATFHEEEE